jgi:hypothetical protein
VCGEQASRMVTARGSTTSLLYLQATTAQARLQNFSVMFARSSSFVQLARTARRTTTASRYVLRARSVCLARRPAATAVRATCALPRPTRRRLVARCALLVASVQPARYHAATAVLGMHVLLDRRRRHLLLRYALPADSVRLARRRAATAVLLLVSVVVVVQHPR